MTKKVIFYKTAGSFQDAIKFVNKSFEDGMLNHVIEHISLFVDKERGIIRLTKRTVSGLHKRFLWVLDDPLLTGEIHSLEERKKVIRILYNKGLNQNEISNFLEISQALVSKDMRYQF